MKTYHVLLAQDIPHYSLTEVEARTAKAAIAKARKIDFDRLPGYEPDWNAPVSKRIVWIAADGDDDEIAVDIPLDNFRLTRRRRRRKKRRAK